jgi:hypothetical protein
MEHSYCVFTSRQARTGIISRASPAFYTFLSGHAFPPGQKQPPFKRAIKRQQKGRKTLLLLEDCGRKIKYPETVARQEVFSYIP